MAGAPERLRWGLVRRSEDDGHDELWIGGNEGLWRLDASGWQTLIRGVRVQCLAESATLGVLAGTFGDGLRCFGAGDSPQIVRSPTPGVTDTLAGNFVHDIDVAPDGSIVLATS